MDMLKGNIYGDIMGMMFGDAGSAWGHLYNFIDETKRSVGLGIDSMGASHFFIHTDYSSETPDVTPIKGLEPISVQASNTALSEAQRVLASDRRRTLIGDDLSHVEGHDLSCRKPRSPGRPVLL